MTGIHVCVGIGAIAGGTGAVLNPLSPMGMPPGMLKNGPFTDFLIPGLFLLCVLGFGNLLAAVALIKKLPFHGMLSGALGSVLMLWIVIQCWMLRAVAALHVIFFLIGAVQGLLALLLLFFLNQFPLDYIRKWLSLKEKV